MLFAVRTIHEEKGESVMSVFFSPREVIWGTDVLGELSVRLRGFRKAAIIIGASGSVVQNGSLERLCGTLQLCGMSYVVIDGIRADPTYKQVCEKARILTETRPDCLIALGGGSVIDAAKVMRLRHLYPDADLYTLVNPQTFPTAAVERPLPLIAIPTTSGTGSEITGGAVITDDETMTKLSISNPVIIPELAVVDASFAASMPRALAANTGMDALTHAIEAYLSIASSPMTDPLALQSSAALLRAICSAVDGNAEAREQMHLYQAMAALAFGSAGLGVVHGIAHAMGARFHIPHGRCNAILLPYALEYNAKKVPGRIAALARAAGICAEDERQLCSAYIEKIRAACQKLGIPATLQAEGIDWKELQSNLGTMFTFAQRDACTYCNPRQVSLEDFTGLITCAYYGNAVTF